MQDIRIAIRVLLKRPALSGIAVLALGLGIGLTTMMFSILKGVVYTDLPFERPDRLMHLETNQLSRDIQSREVPPHDFLDWRAQQKSFESLAAFSDGTINLSGTEKPERFEGAYMTANAFDLLRARPILGRTFQEGDDVVGAEQLVILGYGIWKNRYQSDPSVVGKSIRMNGQAATIIGVMAEGFRFPFNQDIWVPLRLDLTKIQRGEGETLEVFGRLRDGVTVKDARTEMEGITKRLAVEYPKTNEGISSVVKPYTEEFIGGTVTGLLSTMLGAVILVLLIACANVANLLLARTSLRSKELAVRTALGASRKRVMGQLLTESLVLTVGGAIVGVILGYLGVRWFNAAVLNVDKPYWIDMKIDLTVLAFVTAITCFSALICGIMPALQASRADVNTLLKDEGRGSSSFRMGRLAKVLVVGEVALSCGLLVGAGLMARTVVNLRTLDVGFDPERIFTSRIGLFEATFPEKKQVVTFFDDLLQRLDGKPGIVAAGLTTSMPVTGSWRLEYQIDGKEVAEDQLPESRFAAVTPGFFKVLGVTAIDGRLIDERDRADGEQIAVVNRSFAAKVFPNESPIGKRIRPFDREGKEPWRTVVGVVPDLAMTAPDDKDVEGYYVPMSQNPVNFMSLMVRTNADPMSITSIVRDEVSALDRDTPIYFVRSMKEVISVEAHIYEVFGVLFIVFGIAALVLASVGIYGVMAFSVSRRTQEIGVRMALGAQKGDVVGLVLKQGAVQLGIGLALGLVLAWGVSRLIGNIVIGVSPQDPATFIGIALVLTSAGLFACWFPARRAARVDPIIALRYE